MKRSPKNPKRPGTAVNRKAGFDIAVEETLEAGIVLTGEEIKSVRADRVQLTGAYVKLMYGGKQPGQLPEAVLVGMHLSLASDAQRSRRLLLHAREIRHLEEQLAAKGKTAVPLSLHFKHGWLKVKIGIGSGRKKYDKRQLLKERDLDREQRSVLKHGGR